MRRKKSIIIIVAVILVLIIGGYFTVTQYVIPKYNEKIGQAQLQVIGQIIYLIENENEARFGVQNNNYVCVKDNRQ
tara:strand:- start:225 stop:452 length:228 start_codon:yes stop_codon:yes gene_type:complete